MPHEQLEKLKHQKYVTGKKLTAAMHRERQLQQEIKRLTRSERTHRLCTRGGMLETFLREPILLTDDDVMELLRFLFHSEAAQKKLGLLIERRKDEDQMSIRNEIKAQIVRAGFTMQDVVEQLADQYGWSDSVSNLSAKLQRESIRYKEVVELADVLDCDIVWVKRGVNR